jgi:hypothetical protein
MGPPICCRQPSTICNINMRKSESGGTHRHHSCPHAALAISCQTKRSTNLSDTSQWCKLVRIRKEAHHHGPFLSPVNRSPIRFTRNLQFSTKAFLAASVLVKDEVGCGLLSVAYKINMRKNENSGTTGLRTT